MISCFLVSPPFEQSIYQSLTVCCVFVTVKVMHRACLKLKKRAVPVKVKTLTHLTVFALGF